MKVSGESKIDNMEASQLILLSLATFSVLACALDYWIEILEQIALEVANDA